jgi:phosphoglycerate kinase
MQQSCQLFNKLYIDNPCLELAGKRILMRVDFNVPLDDNGTQVRDTQRIVSSIPSINLLLENQVKSIVLMSHLGRPNGEIHQNLSLKPVACVLEKLLGKKVSFIEGSCISKQAQEKCQIANKGNQFDLFLKVKLFFLKT